MSESSSSSWLPPNSHASIAAFAETIVLSSITLTVSYWWRMPFFITAIAIAPIFLIRTCGSVDRGFRLLRLVANRLQTIWSFIGRPVLAFEGIHSTGKYGPLLSHKFLLPIGIPYAILAYFLIFSLVIATMLSIRIFSSVLEFFRSFPSSLKVIPENYMNFLAMTRVFDDPALLPGVSYARLAEYDIDDRIVDFLRPGIRIRRAMREFDIGLIIIALPLYVLLIVAPAIIGRASVKASWPFYGHLAWTVHSNISTPISSIVDSFLRGRFAKTWQALAFIALCLFVVKLSALATMKAQLHRINDTLQGTFALPLIEPLKMPWWQLASGVAAILFYVAYVTCLLLDSHPEWQKNAWVVAFLRVLLVCRSFLGLYATVCGAYIALTLIPPLDWPSFGGPVFPWR